MNTFDERSAPSAAACFVSEDGGRSSSLRRENRPTPLKIATHVRVTNNIATLMLKVARDVSASCGHLKVRPHLLRLPRPHNIYGGPAGSCRLNGSRQLFFIHESSDCTHFMMLVFFVLLLLLLVFVLVLSHGQQQTQTCRTCVHPL